MNWRRRTGFTLTELLTVIAIMSLLISILTPSYTRVRELARRAVCMGNLKTFSAAVQQYAGVAKGVLPSFAEDTDSSSMLGQNCKDLSQDSAGNTRQYYALLGSDSNKPTYMPHRAFFCPSDEKVFTNWSPMPGYVDFPFNDTGPTISYSLAMTKVKKTGSGGVSLTTSDPGSIIIAADHNGAADWTSTGSVWQADIGSDANVNSPNHAREGQHVLSLNGSEIWSQTTAINDDNIWTSANGTSYPRDETDAFLRP